MDEFNPCLSQQPFHWTEESVFLLKIKPLERKSKSSLMSGCSRNHDVLLYYSGVEQMNMGPMKRHLGSWSVATLQKAICCTLWMILIFWGEPSPAWLMGVLLLLTTTAADFLLGSPHSYVCLLLHSKLGAWWLFYSTVSFVSHCLPSSAQLVKLLLSDRLWLSLCEFISLTELRGWSPSGLFDWLF